MKLPKSVQNENINITAGRITGRARTLGDERLVQLSLKLRKDLERLKVYDLERS